VQHYKVGPQHCLCEIEKREIKAYFLLTKMPRKSFEVTRLD
jgi:hypothetical protein